MSNLHIYLKPTPPCKVISVLSGGLDSTILTYLLVDCYGADNVIALSFNYNQRHNIELEKAKITCEKLGIVHKIIDIGFFGDLVSPVCALSDKKVVNVPKIQDVLGDPQPVTYVPFRNMLFLTLAMSFAETNKTGHVFIGLQAHDLYMYWDTTIEFLNKMNEIANLNRQHPIELHAPFVHKSKEEEINWGNSLKVPYEDTWTCYTGPNEKGEACGTCPSCAERIKNFMTSGTKDPINYAIPINWEIQNEGHVHII